MSIRMGKETKENWSSDNFFNFNLFLDLWKKLESYDIHEIKKIKHKRFKSLTFLLMIERL